MSRCRILLPFLFLFGLFTSLPVYAQSDACTDVPVPRLTVYGHGRVTPGNANNIRDTASRSGNLVGQIPGGETFLVLAGPVCADGLNWWQVRNTKVEGWTVEAVGLDYWLEPYDAFSSTVLTPTNEIDYEYEGIRFEVDPAFATIVTAAHIAPVYDDPNYDPPSPVAPEGIKFNFADSNGDTLPLNIRVFSVEDFKGAYEFTGNAVNKLNALLVDDPGWMPPELNSAIPVLGFVESPLLMRARLGELEFANGSGYRFLAQYSFDVHEINNPLEYVFTGLTYDQQYYIIARGSVTTPLLPDKVTQIGYEFEQNFEGYRAEVIKSLKQASNEDFKPNLGYLDSILQSLQVKGESYAVTTTDTLTTVKYGDMGFTLDNSLTADIDYEFDLADWESMSPLPEHVCFNFQWNALSHEWSGSQLCIIPIKGMEGYVNGINQLMSEKPTLGIETADYVRVPKPFNGSAQLIHSNVNYIETDTVRGVGFVTAYAQMDFPITATSLEYNFSGLSADGQYIIFFEYPLYTELLPGGRPTDDEVYQVNLDPPKYYKTIEAILNAAASSDFTPNLDMLTAVVESIHTR